MKGTSPLDRTDVAILRELLADARLSVRELGARVHLSPPAAGERLRRLEEAGIIAGYRAVIDVSRIRPRITAFVNVTMKTPDHQRFLDFARNHPSIRECHRLSGDSCYLLRTENDDHAALETLLDAILGYGNYRLNIALSSFAKLPRVEDDNEPAVTSPA
jgi:Lrp/AsnC family leucine-responsive transcriptional regulator